MSEKNDYHRLRQHLLKPLDRIDRIENGVGVGMPDINFCADGKECWIEQKNGIEPARPATPFFGSNHKLSQDQKNWFKRQVDAGGRCFVLVATNKMWYLVEGKWADHLNDWTVDGIAVVAVWSTPNPIRGKDKWESLRAALLA